MDPLEKAIKIAGGTSALAEKLGLNHSNVVTNWKTRGVPDHFLPEIEKVTNREVRCEDFEYTKTDWAYVRKQA